MIDLENKEERNKLIDDFFNKGLECNIKEVYQAVVNTIADLEYEDVKKAKEIERLKELCEKYEEEHKTTFETWQKDIKENELLHSIIKEVSEYIDENVFHNKNQEEQELYDIALLEILDKENK